MVNLSSFAYKYSRRGCRMRGVKKERMTTQRRSRKKEKEGETERERQRIVWRETR
jgi:hypothetical protein